MEPSPKSPQWLLIGGAMFVLAIAGLWAAAAFGLLPPHTFAACEDTYWNTGECPTAQCRRCEFNGWSTSPNCPENNNRLDCERDDRLTFDPIPSICVDRSSPATLNRDQAIYTCR